MDPASMFLAIDLLQRLIDQDLRRQRVFRDKTNPFDCPDTHFLEIFRLSKPAAWCVIQEIGESIGSLCRRKQSVQNKR